MAAFNMMKLPPDQRLIYRREKHEHDKYCDGDGWIYMGNPFTMKITQRPCKYCARLDRSRNKRADG